jgi:hypothetical protein
MTNSLVPCSLLVAFFTSFSCNEAFGKSVEETATEALAETIATSSMLPKEYAVVVRESRLSLSTASSAERIYLFCVNRTSGARARFSATSTAMNGNHNPIWSQYIRNLKFRAKRSGGTPVPPHAGDLIESTSMNPEESRLLQYPHGHSFPFFRAIAPPGEPQRLIQTESYGPYLLDSLDLIEASRSKDNLIHSIWARGASYVLIHFDPKQGNRPVRFVYANDLSEQNEVESLESVQTIQWQQWELSKAETIWVPVFCRAHHIDIWNNNESETEYHLRWKEPTGKSIIPDPLDHDWREPIRVLFDEDWSMSYANWVQRNSTAK